MVMFLNPASASLFILSVVWFTHQFSLNLCFFSCVTIPICDWIYKNRLYWHILYFEKYYFEILNQLWFSCATL